MNSSGVSGVSIGASLSCHTGADKGLGEVLPRLAEGAVGSDFFQGTLENGELLIVQSGDEELGDRACMDRRRLGQARHARLGQGHLDKAGDAAGHPDREMSARSARSVMRSSPPATAS